MAVSVVVATYGRAHLLPRLIDAVAGQEGVPVDYELVVVDDASPDETAAVLAQLRERSSMAMRIVRLDKNCGPATARNQGWRAAGGRLIAFTDDDCVPQPGWLAALIAALQSADLVQGRTQPDPADLARRGPWSHTVSADGTTGRYETCNMGYRRELLERLGGFDERYRHPYGEDIDLAWRAIEDSATVAYAPGAVVYHEVSPSSYRRRLRETRRQEGIALTVANHPTYRRHLHRGVWVRATHPPALVAALGALVAARRPSRWGRAAVASALALPYVIRRTTTNRLRRRRTWPVTIPLALVIDLVEVAVLARASVRHRTFVL